MSSASIVVAPGDDLYRVAALLYGDVAGWTLLARANGLADPLIQVDATLTVPDYQKGRANDGIF